MPDRRTHLEHLRSQIDRLPDRPSGLLDLGRALAEPRAPLDERECAAHQDTLPDYVEAELNGQPARRLFPDLARHLDCCPACGQAYVDLLETALQTEAEPLPVPALMPALALPFLPPLTLAEQMRQLVETLTEGLVDRLRPKVRADLPAAIRAFFRRREVGESYQPRTGPAFALALGPDLPPALQSVAAVYTATDQIIHMLSLEELSAELSGAWPPRTLQKHARDAARAMGFPRKEADRWADQYVALAQAQAADLLALARQIAEDGRRGG